jgi:hypothetical protein
MKRFTQREVGAVFAQYPPLARRKLLAVRQLIFDTARTTPGVGKLQESLKWGEPAYLTAESGSGSTIRIDWKASQPDQYAVYFNCQTNLVATFRSLFPNDFRFEGSRALVVSLRAPLPRNELAFCLAAALTFHLKKSR